jgi:hypothetical protein
MPHTHTPLPLSSNSQPHHIGINTATGALSFLCFPIHYQNTLGLRVYSYAVDEALPADYLRLRAQALSELYPDDICICSAGQRVVCTVSDKLAKSVNAGKVRIDILPF